MTPNLTAYYRVVAPTMKPFYSVVAVVWIV